MSYPNGEAAILDILQGMAQFNSANSGRAKWGLLNSGNSPYYAILRAGPFTSDYMSVGGELSNRQWATVIELWQRYKDDGTSAIELQTLTEAVVTAIEAEPELGISGLMLLAIRGGDMQEVWNRAGDGPSWLKWEVRVDWTEESYSS